MTTPAPPAAPTPDRSSILIVDDMEENLVALAAVLGPLGQRVVFARSGEEALKAMLRQQFAVVLLDILMPGMDGFETAGNIKRLDQTKDVPIILLTGTDVDPDYAYRGYAVGAADFLAKPIDPWVLRTKVNVFLELHRKNRQLAVQTEQLRRLLITDQSEGTGQAERLTEITWRLMQIESLLRESDGPTTPALADRITELENAVRDLRQGRAGPPPGEGEGEGEREGGNGGGGRGGAGG
ncbi:response regulator [Streptomyces sulfonofaciens]|uniref:Response regulator n=1 Tax=Streptomyces sulfonofaciens TaxID=68272 RepID=A0A919L171_9ACTN|nr:response regulator [Streptomyces sulfonofaciens]GHH80232.1 response regulator [Streptomyces sulfonofaciens]